jgi:hypothetical protein
MITAMRLLILSILVFFLLTSSPIAQYRYGEAYLMFCEIEDSLGVKSRGLVHVGTRYIMSYRACTNGMIFINDNYTTKMSFGWSSRKFERNTYKDWHPSGPPYYVYHEPWNIDWNPSTQVYYAEDITMSCEDRIPGHTYTTTVDSLSGSYNCVYNYNLTDEYVLYDYIPLIIGLPDSFSCEVFYGAEYDCIPISRIKKISTIIYPTIFETVDTLNDWFNTNHEASFIYDYNSLRCNILIESKHFEKTRRYLLKPSYVSE